MSDQDDAKETTELLEKINKQQEAAGRKTDIAEPKASDD